MKNFLFQMLLPTFIAFGKAATITFGQKMHDAHPESFKVVLNGLYPIIDVELEKYAAETANKVDDEVVADLKEVCEKLAEANGIKLPNLDEGKPTD